MVNPHQLTVTFASETSSVSWPVVVSAAAVVGGVQFTATGANAAGMVTELLVQPLLNARRSPTKFYKSAAFVAFSAGSLSATVVLSPGWYAVAYRFVESGTGRAGLQMALGVVQVV